jgi:hypothetical protein
MGWRKWDKKPSLWISFLVYSVSRKEAAMKDDLSRTLTSLLTKLAALEESL